MQYSDRVVDAPLGFIMLTVMPCQVLAFQRVHKILVVDVLVVLLRMAPTGQAVQKAIAVSTVQKVQMTQVDVLVVMHRQVSKVVDVPVPWVIMLVLQDHVHQGTVEHIVEMSVPQIMKGTVEVVEVIPHE